MLAIRVLLLLAPQVGNQNFQLSPRVFHQHHCMLLIWFNELEYLAGLTSVAPLQNAHTLSHLEELDELLGMDLELDRDPVERLESRDLLLVDQLDCTTAALELATDNFASVSDLDLELGIVPCCLEDGLIFHQVPLVLV